MTDEDSKPIGKSWLMGRTPWLTVGLSPVSGRARAAWFQDQILLGEAIAQSAAQMGVVPDALKQWVREYAANSVYSGPEVIDRLRGYWSIPLVDLVEESMVYERCYKGREG
jgi:hypothetical protein